MNNKNNDILVYEDKDGVIKIDVKFFEDNIWLTKPHLANLYETTVENIEKYIKNIYADRELNPKSTCKKFMQVQKGNKRKIEYYNLDMIIELGYFIQSDVAVRFRIWVAKRIHEYLQNGFVLEDDRSK